MELILHRTTICQSSTDGYLTINGFRACDTAERTSVMLATGSYKLLRKHQCFIHGNGVCTLKKPQIIVGERRCHGLVIHSRETYNRLYERIKKAFVRKEVVTLVVME